MRGTVGSPAAFAPARGFLQYLRDRLVHLEAQFADLDGNYIQRKDVFTAFKARLYKLRASLDASEQKRAELVLQLQPLPRSAMMRANPSMP